MTVKRYDANHNYGLVEHKHGNYVRHEDYAELQRQLTAYEATVTNLEAEAKTLKAGVKHLGEKVQGLAAENGSIKVMNDCLSEELRGYESDGAFEGPKMHLLWWKVETPATDAALAEIRAQGVDMFAAETIRIGEEEQDEDIIYAGKQAQLYAQQLRKEQGQ